MTFLLEQWKQPGRIWRSLCHLAWSMVIGTVSFSVLITGVALTIGLLITFPLAVPVAWLTLMASRGFAVAERNRLASLLDVEITDPTAALDAGSWWRRLRQRTRDRARWKELAHGLVLLPLGVLGAMAAGLFWSGGLLMLTLPAYINALPGDSAKFGLFELSSGPLIPLAALVGLVALAVAPTVTQGVTRIQVAAAKALLGQGSGAEITRLEQSRSAAVDSAEAERRRIERDLHDGAQQRLVARAAGLGAAREKLDTDPEGAGVLVAEAHEEAKSALKEIRDLVRGIHPVILEDRGLDAALSAVVARSPVPVSLDVSVAERPPAAVESTAYFVVNEALTNVARHAQATRAHVAIARTGNRLVVEIRDDGVGGADASRGTGLQGLRDRVTGAGGTMHVISPDGGPTTILVELPCGS